MPAPRKGVEERREDCLFFFGSSTEKTWIVPWLEDAHNRVESELKLIEYMVAGCEPLRSSVNSCPLLVSNTLTKVPCKKGNCK